MPFYQTLNSKNYLENFADIEFDCGQRGFHAVSRIFDAFAQPSGHGVIAVERHGFDNDTT